MQKSSAGKFHFKPPFTSLDHLVGNCEYPRRDVEAQLLGGFEIDYQLELGRQHNRQITRLLPFEDASGINASLAICFANARSVAHQAACHDIIAQDIERGNSVS